MTEDRTPRTSIEAKTGVSLKGWLFFIAFVLWLGAQALPYLLTTTTVEQNNRAVQCIIQQLAEHRINNSASHDADAEHHNYEIELESRNIPMEIEGIHPRVCDEWLITVRQQESQKSGGFFGGTSGPG